VEHDALNGEDRLLTTDICLDLDRAKGFAAAATLFETDRRGGCSYTIARVTELEEK